MVTSGGLALPLVPMKNNTMLCCRSSRSRSFLLLLAAITALAGLLRLAVCLHLCPLPFVGEPAVVTDMATYRRLALEIAGGQWPTHFYYQPFYYALFLPLIYATTGSGPWGPALVQVALGTAAVWLTGLAVARVFGRRAALWAAGLLALSRFHIFYTPFLLLEVLQSFWLSLIVYLAVRLWESRSLVCLVLLGLVTGASILTRGNGVLLVPGVVALIAWRWRATPGRAVAAGALFVVLAYTPQLPFALRNLHHFGRWTGPSSAQDAVLALGNSPEAPPGGLEYPVTYHDWMALADRPPGERVPVSRQVLAWIRRSPLQFVELKVRMLLLYWHRQEIPNNINIDREGRHSAVLGWPFLLPFGLIGTLGVLGLLTGFRRRSPRRLFLYYGLGAHCAGTILFYVLARFRLSALPLICAFGGAGIGCAWRSFQAGRAGKPDGRRRGLVTLLAGVAAVFLVLDGFTWYQRTLEARLNRWLRPGGTVVDTPRRVRLYDHGPYAVGGMAAVPVPSEGLVLRKRLILPPALPAVPPLVRVPVLLKASTRFDATLALAERTYGTSAMQVSEEAGKQVLCFTLEPLPAKLDTAEFVLTLRLHQGEMAVLVDALRWYGRSLYSAGGTELPLPAEAALEVEWPRSP